MGDRLRGLPGLSGNCRLSMNGGNDVSYLIVMTLIALGVVGGRLARRFPVDRMRVFAGTFAIIGAVWMMVNGVPWQRWLSMGLAVMLGTYLLMGALRWRARSI